MGHNDHIDFDFHDALNEVIDSGELEENSTELGVAKFAAANGYDALSDKQRYVFDKKVAPLMFADSIGPDGFDEEAFRRAMEKDQS